MYRICVGIFFLSWMAFAEVDLQTGVYDAADEIMAFDKKMDEVIAEHNRQVFDEEEEFDLNGSDIEDFEETKDGYRLQKEIENSKNTKVKVSIEDTLLMITVNRIETKKLEEENSVTSETVMSRTSTSLTIPNNVDKTKMEQDHSNGILTIFFPKK